MSAKRRKSLLRSGAGSWALGAILAYGASPLAVSPAHAESLLDAVELAYTTNPELRAERERARSADEGVAQARSGILPTFTVQGQAGESQIESKRQSIVGFPASTTNEDLDPQSLSFQAVQPVFRGGRTYYSFKQATAQAKSAHAAYRSSEQKFLLSVIGTYMDVRRDEESVRIRENNVSVLRKQLDAAQARFDVGEGTKTDIAQAEARLSGGDAGLAQARAQLDVSRSAYERIVGRKPGSLDPAPDEPKLSANLDDAIGAALASNPDLISAKLAADAARYGIGVSRSALLPQADIVAQANDARESNFQNDRNESASVVGRVTIPLFDAGLARSQVRQSKIERYRADATEEDTQRRTIEGVTTAWSQVLATRAVEAASRAQVAANETAFEGVQQEQQVGLRTPLDVLDAEQELLNARLSAVQAERDAYVAAHTLLAAYGALSVETLKANIGSYNPEKYLRKARRTILSTGVPKLKSAQPDDVAPPGAAAPVQESAPPAEAASPTDSAPPKI